MHTRLDILTWNVQWFCGLDGRVSVERVLAEARAIVDFDVLCLQEVAAHYPGLDGGADFDQAARVQALLPGFEVHYAPAVDEHGGHPDGRRQRFGNLLATRLPAAQVHRHTLPWPAEAGVRSMPRVCLSATLADTPVGPLRVMTTHLEYYARTQRLAQADALRELHRQAAGHAALPPRAGRDEDDGGPFQDKRHAAAAVLCGDFNFVAADDEYTRVQAPVPRPARRLVDAWTVAHAQRPHAPTFRLYDQRYGKEPITCDFFFVSEDLRPYVRDVQVEAASRASDHQPVWLRLEAPAGPAPGPA